MLRRIQRYIPSLTETLPNVFNMILEPNTTYSTPFHQLG